MLRRLLRSLRREALVLAAVLTKSALSESALAQTTLAKSTLSDSALSESTLSRHLSWSESSYVAGGHAGIDWADEQAAAVSHWHVNEEPVVVMVLAVKLPDALILFVGACDPEYRDLRRRSAR